MFDPLLRQVKDRVFDPVAARIPAALSPNRLTLIGFVVGVGVFIALARGAMWIGFSLWALNRILDAMDGAVARMQHRQTDLGGYLDLMSDFLIYSLLPLGVLLSTPHSMQTWQSAVFLYASFYVNGASWMYLSSILERRGRADDLQPGQTVVAMPDGMVGGSETMIFFTLMIVVPQQFRLLALIMGSMVLLGMLQRVVWAVRILPSLSRNEN